MSDAALTPAGRRVLDAAGRLFYHQGIHAVGVDAIAAAAGVTKKTLYDRFGSKDRLVAAYLAERDARWRAWLAGRVGSGGPHERVLRAFDALGEWLARESPRGCAFVNAFAELADPGHPGRAVIADQKRWLREFFAGLVDGAEEPEVLAGQLALLHEGATVSYATGAAGEDAVARAREAAAVLLDPQLSGGAGSGVSAAPSSPPRRPPRALVG